MALAKYIAELLARGRAWFSKEEAGQALGQSSQALSAALTRFIKKRILASPRRGFYLILRPEDQATGPDPARWIDPLMKYLLLDYRISLLRAAAFHGSSHQAAMVFQVVAPEQLRAFDLGRHRIQFVYQAPAAFVKINRPDSLGQLKTGAGFAQVAGIELTLLDTARYFHKAGGIQGAAQIVHDLGGKANPHKLSKAAAHYENSAVRRLGYLLDCFGHRRQASALAGYAKRAKSMKALDPSVQSLIQASDEPRGKNSKWMLVMNETLEIDS